MSNLPGRLDVWVFRRTIMQNLAFPWNFSVGFFSLSLSSSFAQQASVLFHLFSYCHPSPTCTGVKKRRGVKKGWTAAGQERAQASQVRWFAHNHSLILSHLCTKNLKTEMRKVCVYMCVVFLSLNLRFLDQIVVWNPKKCFFTDYQVLTVRGLHYA